MHGVTWFYWGYIFELSGLPIQSANVKFTRFLFMVRVRIYVDGTMVCFRLLKNPNGWNLRTYYGVLSYDPRLPSELLLLLYVNACVLSTLLGYGDH